MKITVFAFGVVYLLGAVWFIYGHTPMPEMKNLAVLAFFLPGVVALVTGLEVERLRHQIRELCAKGKAPSAS